MKADIDALEALWWRWHNDRGDIMPPAEEQDVVTIAEVVRQTVASASPEAREQPTQDSRLVVERKTQGDDDSRVGVSRSDGHGAGPLDSSSTRSHQPRSDAAEAREQPEGDMALAMLEIRRHVASGLTIPPSSIRFLFSTIDTLRAEVQRLTEAQGWRPDDYEWAHERVTKMAASALVDAAVYGRKLLKGFGYPDECFGRAQDARALQIVIAMLPSPPAPSTETT